MAGDICNSALLLDALHVCTNLAHYLTLVQPTLCAIVHIHIRREVAFISILLVLSFFFLYTLTDCKSDAESR